MHYYVNIYLKNSPKIGFLIMRKNTTTVFAPHVNVTTLKESCSLRWARLKSRPKEEKIMSSKGQKFHITMVTKGEVHNYLCT
jgi:hypothetical protein